MSKATSAVDKLLAGRRLPRSWSVSRWNDYKVCATHYALKHIVKLCTHCGQGSMVGWPVAKCNRCGAKPEGNAAMDRGTMIHAKGESYLKGRTTGPVPDEFRHFAKELKNLRTVKAQAEAQWTITADFKPTEPDDWANAWLRAKIDAHIYWEEDDALTQVDYKTGRIYPADAQAEVYAMLAPVYYPKVKSVESEFWYTDQNDIKKYGPYSAKDIVGLTSKWTQRAVKMLRDDKFLPTPGPKCAKCPYRSSQRLGNVMGPCDGWRSA